MVELIRVSPGGPSAASDDASGDALESLTPGRLLKAWVVGPQPGGLTQIRLLGQSLLAESSQPLTPGQTLELVVQETKPQLVLALVPQTAPQASPLQVLLQEMARGRQLLAQNLAALLKPDLAAAPLPSPKAADLAMRLQDLARQLLLPEGATQERRGLADMIRASGLDLEARLADLAQGKITELPPSLRLLLPALARELEALLPQLARDNPAQAALYRDFLAAGQGLADFFADNARLNAQLLPQALFFLGLPLPWGQPPSQGEVLIDLPDPSQPEQPPQSLNLVFFLELAALGPLAIEVLLRGADLQGVFLTEAPAQAEFLEELLPGLAQRLSVLGYRAQLTARARPAQTTASAAPLAQIIRRQGQYLSLKV